MKNNVYDKNGSFKSATFAEQYGIKPEQNTETPLGALCTADRVTLNFHNLHTEQVHVRKAVETVDCF